MFEEMLDDIGKQNNPRPHKRLKFLGRELLEWQLVEVQLLSFFEKHFDEVERLNLLDSLTGAEGECRVCECLLALMYHAEKRIDKHQEVFSGIFAHSLLNRFYPHHRSSTPSSRASKRCVT